MRPNLIATAALSMFAVATAGCGDDPSCEKVARHMQSLGPALIPESGIPDIIQTCKDGDWSGSVRRCVMAAKGMEDVARCAAKDDERPRRSRGRVNEAELNLNAIEKAAKAEYAEMEQFPQATQPLTPAQSCCEFPGKKCPVVAADWNGVPAWDALGFEMTQPFFYQYSYTSEAPNAFVATAVGDLDCDGTTVTYELRGTVQGGRPIVRLSKPDRPD